MFFVDIEWEVYIILCVCGVKDNGIGKVIFGLLLIVVLFLVSGSWVIVG